MSNGESIALDKLVKTYIKIRERRSELKAEFDEEDAPLVQQLETVKGALLTHCKQHEVDSVKTSEGLFYRTVKQSYWTSDWDKMHEFILEHGEPSLLDKRINQKNMKQFLEENPELLPKGLNSNSEYTVTVRRNKK
tara:strand:+ start:139 stop:546 length:408 start_codon:yes stop_codon:yes gene_type:complete